MQVLLLNDNIITSYRQTSKSLEGWVQLNTREPRCLSEVYLLSWAGPGWNTLKTYLTLALVILFFCVSLSAFLRFSFGLLAM